MKIKFFAPNGRQWETEANPGMVVRSMDLHERAGQEFVIVKVNSDTVVVEYAFRNGQSGRVEKPVVIVDNGRHETNPQHLYWNGEFASYIPNLDSVADVMAEHEAIQRKIDEASAASRKRLIFN